MDHESNRRLSEPQKDSWNDPSGPIQVFNVRSPRRTEEVGPKQEDGLGYGPDLNNDMADGIKAERAKESRFRRIGKRVLGIAIGIGGAVALYLAADKEPNKRMEREAWLNAMQKEAAGYNASLSYGEDASSIAFIGQHNGVQTYYLLEDTDNNSLIDKGHSSNSLGGAEFESENGTTVKDAINRLNMQMDKGN